MSEAIRVEEIWKSYMLGSHPTQYGTLRDAVAHRVSRLLKHQAPRPRRERFWALQDVSFSIQQGEAVGIIGRNGAGKTTALKILSRITRPTKGRAVVHGRVGSLLEVGTGFSMELTGRENVQLNGAILGMSRGEIQRKLDQIVDFADIVQFIDTPVKRYSSGMQMRLAFSIAAHLEPEIMLVDEVLAVGDQEFQRKCLSRIGEIEREGRTVVLISHNLAVIQRVCKRSLLLDQGNLVADGPTDDVVRSYGRATAAVDGRGSGAGPRPNQDLPRFLGWSLRGQGQAEDYVLKSGSPCEFIFRLNIPRPLRKAFFGLAIYAADGTLVYALSSYEIEEEFRDLAQGVHNIVFSVPEFPVGAGAYRPYVTVNTRGSGTVEAWHAHPEFDVSRRRQSLQVPPPWEGILSVPGAFSVESGLEVGGGDQQVALE
jgi:homopolymeric O-antigen transport system ATP-binding protein